MILILTNRAFREIFRVSETNKNSIKNQQNKQKTTLILTNRAFRKIFGVSEEKNEIFREDLFRRWSFLKILGERKKAQSK
jgi:hypothetical protein